MKGNKVLILILLLSISAIYLVGCNTETADSSNKEVKEVVDSKDEFGITITEDNVSFVDGSGEEVSIHKNPKRVVVLFSSFLDIWTKNGGELIGMVEDTSGSPIPGTEGVETVGRTGAISLEKIISLEPDLVILSSNTSSQMEMVPSLKQNNIPVIAFDYKFKEDYYKMVKLFTAINEREDLYEENVLAIEKEIQEIVEKTSEEKPKKVFLMFASSKSLEARGSNSTVGEIFADLNAVNITDESGVPFEDQSFSMEKLIEEDPEYIFVITMGSDMEKVQDKIKADAESNPAWASLSAVKNNKYIFLPKELFTYKANERYAEAYEYVAKILYPEAFSN
ncbi:ABC transporter substrate-binding protein [Tissierella creatinini]|nr:ABC transporter substrate-binding protein [Tissierella creatinini]TJX65605.1 ABC transporter substrate-binding protein [Soehngenia saccharolytica]